LNLKLYKSHKSKTFSYTITLDGRRTSITCTRYLTNLGIFKSDIYLLKIKVNNSEKSLKFIETGQKTALVWLTKIEKKRVKLMTIKNVLTKKLFKFSILTVKKLKPF